MSRVLSVENLSVTLEVERQRFCVVEDLSFSLEAGKTLALVGESGCGKTMAALSIMGILPKPPALRPEGRILFHGEDLLGLPEKRLRRLRGNRLGMVFQDPMSALNPVYQVGTQLAEVLDAHMPLPQDKVEGKLISALREVGLANAHRILSSYPHELSGGTKQRVMIAMALLCEPDILIADEPTTALDVTVQAQVLELIRDLQLRRQMAVLLITHDMGVVAELADEVLVMYAAKSVEYATVGELFDRPSHPYTQGLFRSRPSLKGPCGRLQPIPGRVPPPTDFPSGCRFHPRCDRVMERCKREAPPKERLCERHDVQCWLHSALEEGE